MKRYKINEIFYSLQGEGMNAGTPAIFIRFAGCNLRCPFCDTDFDKSNDYNAAGIALMAASLAKSPLLIVLTGGEPTLQVDNELLQALHLTFPDSQIAIETNGSRPIINGIDFVTCSPKGEFTSDYKIISEADEVKVVYDGKNNPATWEERIKANRYYLQPCDMGDNERNAEIVKMSVEYCKAHPKWRLSLQQHKILNLR